MVGLAIGNLVRTANRVAPVLYAGAAFLRGLQGCFDFDAAGMRDIAVKDVRARHLFSLFEQAEQNWSKGKKLAGSWKSLTDSAERLRDTEAREEEERLQQTERVAVALGKFKAGAMSSGEASAAIREAVGAGGGSRLEQILAELKREERDREKPERLERQIRELLEERKPPSEVEPEADRDRARESRVRTREPKETGKGRWDDLDRTDKLIERERSKQILAQRAMALGIRPEDVGLDIPREELREDGLLHRFFGRFVSPGAPCCGPFFLPYHPAYM